MKVLTRALKKLIAKEFLKTIVLIAVIVGLFGSGIFMLWASSLPIPDFESFEARKIAQSTKIYDRTGETLLWSIGSEIQRTVITSDQMSVNVRNATVAIEDSQFYTHKGVRPMAILRAVIENIKAGSKVQGGSTITQQVVKNALLTTEKAWSRKLKEAVLAYRLEKVMTKDEILEVYLNEIPYGGTIYGVEEASQTFFGKPAIDLGLAESAYLAAIPKAPTFYSPYGNNTEKLEERKNTVLNRMAELNFISVDEARAAKAEIVEFLPRKDRSIRAPHFVMFVREYLENTYGNDVVENGGLKVITTLDWDKQRIAEEVVTEYGDSNEERFGVKNAGMLVMDPKTGQVLAMVGSRDYFDTENDGNFNVTLAKRQPGSSFKPFVYATAFNKGYTPETVIFDVSTEFFSGCNADSTPKPGFSAQDCYRPRNYTNLTYGPLSLRSALQGSINIVAVKLLYLAGIRDSIATARAMGITTLTDPDRYGLTLVLGGGEVKLIEMVNAYSVFATEGIRNPYTPILKIEDISGNVLEEYKQKPTRALSAETSRLISDVLSDDEARAYIFGRGGSLYIPGYQVAVKTGTTNDARDAWVVGYTPNIAVGAWVGNNDNSPIGASSGGAVAPMWNAYMRRILPTVAREEFNKPQELSSDLKPILRGIWQGGETFIIDTVSGKLATEFTPESSRKEVALANIHSILHWVNKSDPRGPSPANPERDSQYENWETSVAEWVALNAGAYNLIHVKPTEFDDVHTSLSIPNVSILNPIDGATYVKNSPITVNLSISSERSVNKIDYYLDGILIGTTRNSFASFNFTPSVYATPEARESTLRVIVYDDILNRGEASVNIKYN